MNDKKKREREKERFLKKILGRFGAHNFFQRERERKREKKKEEENLGFRVLMERGTNKQKIQKMSSLSKRARTFVYYIHTL
jgi:hypothetical protein